MNREQLLQGASYPAFKEGLRRQCLKLHSIGARTLIFHEGSRLRLMASSTAEFAGQQGPAGELLALFRVGDWVGVELDVQGRIKNLRLLAPHLKEAPEPRVSPQTLREWNLFLKSVRQFFEKRDFLEVGTPTLVICPGTEPHLDVFKTKFKMGRREQDYFLPTSPELHLKKLVAAGYGSIFEMRPCFRNGEVTDHHQPEFWMLEWYRPGHDLASLRKDCLDLIQHVQKSLGRALTKKSSVTTMAALFEEHTGFELTPSTTAAELEALAQKLGVRIAPNSDFDDCFFQIFLEKVEPALESSSPVFVGDYPPSQAALARLTEEGWGDRFELYWKGLELANAYNELNDPRLQRERSADDLRKKAALGRETVALDEDFYLALESGMPPTAGIALGLERLFLALTNRKSLNEVRLFPVRT
ncbi:MAG: EF-P lysine aminoacylase GenX [Bdellovibrionaceae bacterium]|nr:EF-P lysine aminoacylase GenX [Pseudobdellovibrionaceae bacterium]